MFQTAQSSVDQKRCFVVMGFGIKTDYATGRKLDLDKAYRAMVKPVVQARGLTCVRADEIRHSGTIDVPMYQELLTADVVIADISTANANAIYELGIRHALRPRTTIVISENKLPYPFDLNHVLISSYTHLGDVIDYDEVLRFQTVLGETLDAVLRDERIDSPVYTYLKLTPPALEAQAQAAISRASAALQEVGKVLEAAEASTASGMAAAEQQTLAVFVAAGEQAIRDSRFTVAKEMFKAAVALCSGHEGLNHAPDSYLVQRLALATYKEKQPTAAQQLDALKAAMEIVDTLLHPAESNDPETLGLAGAIEKRLFERGQGDAHLDRAVRNYARGYFLRNDRYNGINLAYLLNVRADASSNASDQERIADMVWANRIRREVLSLCQHELVEIRERRSRKQATPTDLQTEQRNRDWEEEFWCQATQAEAYFGLGQHEHYSASRTLAAQMSPEPASWMVETLDSQISNLRRLLQTRGHLLEPRWQLP